MKTAPRSSRVRLTLALSTLVLVACGGASDGSESEAAQDLAVEQETADDSTPQLGEIPDVVTGFDSLFIGHSFFRPFAQGMSSHGPNAGFTDHTQDLVFAGGANGAPEALWNDPVKRAQIQAVLDRGEVDLFGMTVHGDYPGLDGYRNWLDYALARNPDTRFFIAMPWLPNPASMDAATYSATRHEAHETRLHGAIDALRLEYPGVDIYGIPYGQAAVELYDLFEAGHLPDVDTLVSGTGDAIFRDNFGHADDFLVELGDWCGCGRSTACPCRATTTTRATPRT